MVLSKREQYVSIVTLALFAILVFDKYVASPIWDEVNRTRTEKQQLLSDIENEQFHFQKQY